MRHTFVTDLAVAREYLAQFRLIAAQQLVDLLVVKPCITPVVVVVVLRVWHEVTVKKQPYRRRHAPLAREAKSCPGVHIFLRAGACAVSSDGHAHNHLHELARQAAGARASGACSRVHE